MHDAKRWAWGLMLTATMIGCGGESSTQENVEDAVIDEVVKQTGRAPSSDTTPCEILDDALIRAHFRIGAEVEITRSPSKYSPQPLCTVTWPKPDAAEIEKKAAEGMAEYMKRKMAGEDVQMPSFRTTNEVTLTLVRPVSESPEQASAFFEESMRRLSEGITASHGGVEMTFQADLTPVEGVGDQAAWAAKMRQLSVVADDQIFHVTVNTGAETDLETAKAIAVQIMERLPSAAM